MGPFRIAPSCGGNWHPAYRTVFQLFATVEAHTEVVTSGGAHAHDVIPADLAQGQFGHFL